MKSYVVCPVCGTKLGKAEEIKALEFQCTKCHEDLLIDVTPNGVKIARVTGPSLESARITQNRAKA